MNIKEIQNDIDNDKRVLIVCNTIKKAQEVFEQIECPKKIMLHSAFNVNDRKCIEQEIIESETKNDNEKNQVLIGTQAIEVSLDLDYDCCYSEIASIDALIQRFGRVFRNRKRAKGEYGIVNVFLEADDATKLIYNEKNEDFISRTRQELFFLDNKPLDYQSICDAVDKVFPESYGNLIEKIVVEKLELRTKRPSGGLKKQRERLYSLTLKGFGFYNFLYNEKVGINTYEKPWALKISDPLMPTISDPVYAHG